MAVRGKFIGAGDGSVSVRVTNLNDVLSDLNLKINEVKKDVQKEISTTANEIRNGAVQAAPTNLGHLRTSIEIQYQNQMLSAWIGSNLKYAAAIEKGRRGGWLPFPPILEWVKKKGIAGSFSIKTKKASKSKSSQAAVKTAAYFIWKSIKEKGFKAKPFLGPAYDRAIPKFLVRLQQLKHKR